MSRGQLKPDSSKHKEITMKDSEGYDVPLPDGYSLVTVNGEGQSFADTSNDVYREARRMVESCGEKCHMLNGIPILLVRGSVLTALVDKSGVTVSFRVNYYGKKKSTIWQPYVNAYLTYTVIPLRRRYLATWLNRRSRWLAVKKGCRRLKSLAGSELGLLFNVSFGDQLWGIARGNDGLLDGIVDTPLVNPALYNGRVPPITANMLNGPLSIKGSTPSVVPRVEPFTVDEMHEALDRTGEKLRWDMMEYELPVEELIPVVARRVHLG